MAGISRFIAGEEANANDIYWSMSDNLSFDLELTGRRGGHDDDPTVVSDYGSDIGVDPQIVPGDLLKFIRLDAYSGIWITSGTELDFSKVEAAVKRVRFNRFLLETKDRHQKADVVWLRELATQTRKRVVANNLTFNPAPIGDLRRFSKSILEWLANEERLLQLSESSFECLLMTLVDKMGYQVKPVGDTRRKDGGIDIIAWPEHGLPHLLAIQAKHHRSKVKTSVRVVRDFLGAIEANPIFSFGLLITNTDFTADAKAFAEKVPSKIRLRSGRDIVRWLNDDVTGEADWLPKEVEIALGVTTKLAVAPNVTDMGYELRRVRAVLDMFLPTGDYPMEPFGKLFESDGNT